MGEAKGKIAVLCLPGLEGFLGDIVDRLREKYEVQTCYEKNEQKITDLVKWADVVWLEWANELAVQLTQHPEALKEKKVVLRLHSYEAISGYISAIDWNKIDECIFVAEHVRRVTTDQLNQLKDAGKLARDFGTWVIPNGIDVGKYKLDSNKARNHNLCVLGHISNKKGPMLMLHAFHRLHTLSKKYKLFVGGKFQEARYALYLNHMSGQLKLQEHMKFVGEVKDVGEFFSDKSFILCTSPWEGCPVGVLEGMACGCKPLIHNFLGAEALYPKEFLWNTIPELTTLAKSKDWNPASYRKFVDDNYSLNTALLNIEQVVDGCFKDAPAVRGGAATVGDVVEIGAELNRVVDEVDREIHLFEKPEDLLPDQPKVMPEPVKVRGPEIKSVNWDKAQGKAVKWIFNNTDKDSGLVKISHRREGVYPEVSGYLIPSLLRLQDKAMGLEMAEDLAAVQQEDGSWLGTDGLPYAFDTAQALRGMLAAWDRGFGVPKEEAEKAAKKAVQWFVDNISEDGQLPVPQEGSTAWNMGDRGSIPEEIHLYCLPPLARFSVKMGVEGQLLLQDLVKKCKNYYLRDPDKLTEFNQPNMSSHFYCYIQEALIELGESGLARKGMESLKQYIGQAGDVPAFSNVPWVNSAGQAQAALCFFRLGEKEMGEKLLKFMATLQLPSGGFYGSYGYQADYFTDEQIPWPVKYYLDAIWWLDRPVLGKPKKGKKVLAVVPNDPLQAYVDAGYPDQTEYFNPKGYWDEVYCISPQESERKEMYGMKVWPTAPSEFNKALEDCGAEVLRVYDMRVLNVLANQEKPPIPLVCSVHDVNPKRVSAQWPKVDHFMAVSKAVKDFLIDSVGVPEEKIEVIPNRVDMEKFKPVKTSAITTECKYKVLFVGRLVEQKNLDTLIKAMGVLGDDYSLTVIGKGDRAKYEAIAREVGCDGRITWHESAPSEVLSSFYSSCDCFCVPSRWEGFGIVFIEALACGAAVVTSDIAPMNEFMGDGVNGLLVSEYENYKALAEAIAFACDEHPIIETMKQNARESVKQFSKKIVDEQEVEMYKRVREMTIVPQPKAPPLGRRETRQGYEIVPMREGHKEDWDSVVSSSEDSWLYHTWDWQTILKEAWNAENYSFLIYDKDRPVAICPLYRHLGNPGLLDSTIMGPAGFAVVQDYGDRIEVLKSMAVYLRSLTTDGACNAVKLWLPVLATRWLSRTEQSHPIEELCRETGCPFADGSTKTMVIDLYQHEDDIWKGFHRSTKQRIKQSEKKHDLRIYFLKDAEEMNIYYDMHVKTYKRTGVNPHPKAYFDLIWKYFGNKYCRIWFASYEGRVIAALNVATYGEGALYWTSASDYDFKHMQANRRLQLEAMRWCKVEGYHWYEMGEVFPEEEKSKLAGLTEYKQSFGGEVRPFYKGVIVGGA